VDALYSTAHNELSQGWHYKCVGFATGTSLTRKRDALYMDILYGYARSKVAVVGKACKNALPHFRIGEPKATGNRGASRPLLPRRTPEPQTSVSPGGGHPINSRAARRATSARDSERVASSERQSAHRPVPRWQVLVPAGPHPSLRCVAAGAGWRCLSAPPSAAPQPLEAWNRRHHATPITEPSATRGAEPRPRPPAPRPAAGARRTRRPLARAAHSPARTCRPAPSRPVPPGHSTGVVWCGVGICQAASPPSRPARRALLPGAGNGMVTPRAAAGVNSREPTRRRGPSTRACGRPWRAMAVQPVPYRFIAGAQCGSAWNRSRQHEPVRGVAAFGFG